MPEPLKSAFNQVRGYVYSRAATAASVFWGSTCSEQDPAYTLINCHSAGRRAAPRYHLLPAAALPQAHSPPSSPPYTTHNTHTHPQRWTLGSATLAPELKARGPLVKIDAVGSGWLYVKSEVHRDGAIFTTEPVIGGWPCAVL